MKNNFFGFSNWFDGSPSQTIQSTSDQEVFEAQERWTALYNLKCRFLLMCESIVLIKSWSIPLIQMTYTNHDLKRLPSISLFKKASWLPYTASDCSPSLKSVLRLHQRLNSRSSLLLQPWRWFRVSSAESNKPWDPLLIFRFMSKANQLCKKASILWSSM